MKTFIESTKCQIWKVPLATLNYSKLSQEGQIQSGQVQRGTPGTAHFRLDLSKQYLVSDISNNSKFSVPIMYKNHLQSQKQLYPTNYKTYDKDFKFYCPTCKEYFEDLTEGRAPQTAVHNDLPLFSTSGSYPEQEEESIKIHIGYQIGINCPWSSEKHIII